MPLKVGKNGEADGMTQAIENAFRDRWAEYQSSRGLPGELSEIGEEERRLLFSAIAEGVLKHLRDHLPDEDAVTMSVTVEQDETEAEPILSNNVSRIPVKREYAGGVNVTGDFINSNEA